MNKALAILSIMYSTLKILVNLIGIWLMLGWNTRRARKSFEAKLMTEGMSKRDAQNLSQFYSELKDQFSIKNLIRTSISTRNKPKEK